MNFDHLPPWVAPPLAFMVTWLVLQVLLRSQMRSVLLDQPNERSLHRAATPRIGGIGLLAGIAAVVLACILPADTGLPTRLAAPMLGYLALFLISIVDDARGLAASIRLMSHLLVAGATVFWLGVPDIWIVPLAIALAWGANLFNFMDGSDGLAGGMAAIGFGSLALAASWAADIALAALAAATSAAALGFLMLNFNPARLFMGDSGSIPLGFLAGALAVAGNLGGAWPAWTPLIVFFPFLFDATLTLGRRALAGKPLSQAHREHLYQRAVLGGLTHRSLALRAYGLMLVSAILGLASIFLDAAQAGLIIIIQVAIGLHIDRRMVAAP